VENINYIFEKNGTFKYSKVKDGLLVENSEGIWSFLDKNKHTDTKKKEAIILTYTSYLDEKNYTSIYTGFADGQVLYLDQLKNKEIIIKWDLYDNYHDGSEINASVGSITLKAK
jgi:hypothetical protein